MEKSRRSFYLIVISQIINLVGGAMLRFTLSLHVLDITGSAEIFAAMIAISFIPVIIFTPLGGAIADRFSKKNLMVLFDCLNTLLAGSLAILLFSGIDSVILIGVVITLLSLVSTCYHPVVTASLPVILKQDELMKANGVVQGVGALSDFIAPILAGILYGPVGVTKIVVICAICFLFSTIINIFIKIPHEKRESSGGMVKTIYYDLKEGLLYIVKGDPVLLKLALVLSVVVMLFMSAFSVAMPYVIRIIFEMSEEHFGFAQAGIGAAMLLGSVAVGTGKLGSWLHIKRIPKLLGILGIVSLPLAVAVLPNLINNENNLLPYILFTLGFMLIMFIFSIINILAMVSVQEKVPSHLVGKVMAIMMSIVSLATPIGQFLLGFLLETFASQLFILFFVISILTFLIGIIAKRMKWLS